MMYPQIVRLKVGKEMKMMMTQPMNSRIEWKGNEKLVYKQNLNQYVLQLPCPTAE